VVRWGASVEGGRGGSRENSPKPRLSMRRQQQIASIERERKKDVEKAGSKKRRKKFRSNSDNVINDTSAEKKEG